MPTYIAFLRAVNVGGSGKLPMAELRKMCEAEGFGSVETYIASGNVVFTDPRPAAKVKAGLEKRLHAYAGKPVPVILRTAQQLAAVLEANPFPLAPANSTLAILLDEPPAVDALQMVRGQQREQLGLGVREIYVAYRDGIGRSKLRIPAAESGTGRNMNTIAGLVALAAVKGRGN